MTLIVKCLELSMFVLLLWLGDVVGWVLKLTIPHYLRQFEIISACTKPRRVNKRMVMLFVDKPCLVNMLLMLLSSAINSGWCCGLEILRMAYLEGSWLSNPIGNIQHTPHAVHTTHTLFLQLTLVNLCTHAQQPFIWNLRQTLYNVHHMQTVVKTGIHVDTPAPVSPRENNAWCCNWLAWLLICCCWCVCVCVVVLFSSESSPFGRCIPTTLRNMECTSAMCTIDRIKLNCMIVNKFPAVCQSQFQHNIYMKQSVILTPAVIIMNHESSLSIQ